jgi:hypothetical protein
MPTYTYQTRNLERDALRWAADFGMSTPKIHAEGVIKFTRQLPQNVNDFLKRLAAAVPANVEITPKVTDNQNWRVAVSKNLHITLTQAAADMASATA